MQENPVIHPAPIGRIARRALSLALLLGACGGPPSRERVLDLLALFPYTRSGLAATRIELGGPDAAPHLRNGWFAPAGGSAAIGALAGTTASLQIAIRTPGDGRLVVRCGLLADQPGGPVSVRVSLNGHRVGILRVRPGVSEYTMPLRAEAQRTGLNVLTFTRARMRRPGESGRSRGAGGTRDEEPARAAAGFVVETVAFEGIDAGAGARIANGSSASPQLVLPPSAAVDFFLRLPRAGRLTFGAGAEGDAHGGRLRVTLQLDGEGERVLFDGPPPSGGAAVELGDRQRRLGRLTFAATGAAEVRVAAPRILEVAESRAARAAAAAGDTGGPTEPRVAHAAVRSVRIGTRTPRDGEPPNVLLYVVDTLRADHLGCYGYPRPTSPAIDGLAAGGVVFGRAIAQSSWTKPATASMLTGRTPSAHGAVDPFTGIRPGIVTLAEVLRQHGYRTAAFVTNVNVRPGLGFERGFEQYVYLAEDRARPTVHVPADALDDRVVRWLDESAGEGPFFIYVHASDPHAPYVSPAAPGPDGVAPARERVPSRPPGLPPDRDPLKVLRRDPAARTAEHVAYLRALYDREVAFVDGAIRQLLDALRARGLYDDTLVVVTADHGEEFYEHGGFEHGRTLYREQLAVPLVVRFPGGEHAGRRIPQLARQIDILPTLLTYLDVPIPADVQGSALAPVVGGDRAADEDDAIVAADLEEAYSETRLGGGEVVALSTPDWKVIHRLRRDGPTFEQYELDRDPGETRNVAAERPIVLGYVEQRLARWAATSVAGVDGVSAGGADLDADTAATLRALGYLDDGRSE